jgi:hypothetical protein
MSPNRLKIAIDLGSDGVKTAFAFVNENGDVVSGKITPPPPDDVTFPSLAYLDEASGVWSFGEKVFEGVRKTFKTVVKIKDLLTLLIPNEAEGDLSDYYFNGREFPVFFFPKKKGPSGAEKLKTVFGAKETPQEVLEAFFKNLYEVSIGPAVENLRKKYPFLEEEVEFVPVYPAKAKQKYVEELKRLIESACGKVADAISVPKAVGLFAYCDGALNNDCRALIADIGERDLSVAKIRTLGAGITVDGADAHNEPVEIGGENYDEALRAIIENKIAGREVIGRGTGGAGGNENGTHYQQFVLMNNIKSAKKNFDEVFYPILFSSGVPIDSERDVTVEIRIKKEEFIDETAARPDSVSVKIAAYIISELSRPNDQDITRLVLSGGAAETAGLKVIVANALRLNFGSKISLVEFKKGGNDDKFSVPRGEEVLYAAAVGGAISAVGKYVVKTVASLTYGIGLYPSFPLENGMRIKHFSVLIGKGAELPKEELKFSTKVRCGDGKGTTDSVSGIELFSTTETGKFTGQDLFPVFEPADPRRKEMIRRTNLVNMGAEKGSGILRFSRAVPMYFTFDVGFKLDQFGNVELFAENRDSDVSIKFDGMKTFKLETVSREIRSRK